MSDKTHSIAMLIIQLLLFALLCMTAMKQCETLDSLDKMERALKEVEE
jgi:hypothetical protein